MKRITDRELELERENAALRALLAECRETLGESRRRFERYERPTDEIDWLLAQLEAERK